MQNDTKNEILAYIKEKNSVSAKDIISHLHLHPTGVFRHLKYLASEGVLFKSGKPPLVLYHPSPTNQLEIKSPKTLAVFKWAISGEAYLIPKEQLCQTRDVFQARSERLLAEFKDITKNENLSFLLLAIIGEIGNNSFDHNLGSWRDATGIAFAVDKQKRYITLADRGQGVLATIRRVRPKIIDDAAALHIAFTEMISGRYPEQRGNGLKFVRKIIQEQNLHLQFYSGNASCEISHEDMNIKQEQLFIPGTFALIQF